ncbi:MAG: hypothetical protein WDN28_33270 [Chthoniobacter sp.]
MTDPNLSFLFSSAGGSGDVTVQPGAELSAPTSAAHVGGRVALIGPNVTNAGTISTPDGQTVLAAGLQIGMLAHPGLDPSLRGVDVFVGNVDSTSGTATNTGLIETPRASTVITGKQVDQLGGHRQFDVDHPQWPCRSPGQLQRHPQLHRNL